MSVFTPGFHAEVLGAPIGRRAERQRPGSGSFYALGVMQISDWIADGGARDEIRATCRRWLDDDAALVDVEIRHPSGHVLERVTRAPTPAV